MGESLNRHHFDLERSFPSQTMGAVISISKSGLQHRARPDCRARNLFKDCGLDFDISELHMARRQTLFIEEDPTDCFFEIVQGTACLYKTLEDGRRQIVKFATPGSIIGLTVVDRHELTAEIVSPATVLRIRPRSFREHLAQNPKVSECILAHMYNELVEAHEQILTIGQKTSVERVATFIWQMAGQCECRNGPLDHVPLSMTRGDIADFLGLTMETVSRTISHLQDTGVIVNTGSSSLQILDNQRLRELADGNAA